ncbi:MAG: cbb3-type cytochrome oxidase assembly protein CcoS [Gammaproteobacteria bacterium]|nr:cbb3-type cytochrome oxidase assembly protein CcoS [Gammaproteobacteria bacterium]
MSSLYVLIPLGLGLLALAIWAFFWAVGSGQFDDLDTPGWSVLIDDDPPPASKADTLPPAHPPDPESPR